MRNKIALISVYNKEGIIEFAKELVQMGWKIISSGGTAKHLASAGIEVLDVAEITGMPPILDHRVLTLHPKIHGGLLVLDKPEHLAELEKYGIPWIDLVCVDLYPLEEEIAKGRGREAVLEKTDMGGVALLRSSAKGGRITICDQADRMEVIEWLKAGEPDKENFLNNLRAKTENVISKYCETSAEYHDNKYRAIFGEKVLECAYGENAYQKPAGLFTNGHGDVLGISNWKLLEGSPLSYNNICDVDRMLQTVTHIAAGFDKNFSNVPKIAIGVKHGNACGAGVASVDDFVQSLGPSLRSATPSQNHAASAIEKMLQGDLRAIFGGSVMLNFEVDEKVADELIHRYAGEDRRLLDIVAAPSFTTEAIEILSRKKGKCRLLVNPAIEKAGLNSIDTEQRFRYVRGGFLQQPNYTFVPEINNRDVILAWAIGCTSNSNTITLVKDSRLVGNGVGQQDRVGAAKLAIFRADESARELKNSADGRFHPKDGVMSKNFSVPGRTSEADLEGTTAYSDSFFPFPDAPEVLIARGIKTIFSTSGSVNDEKIIELCKSKGVNLIMLPDTEARGFYQH
ncbi:hypothetical protein A3I95_02370 [Candidatus Nomurabacteria bacterium RIFCSPLOWO2_02_FULL_44_12]|nr:MAG: hypothetical protein A3I95_02370 [Candidatus Nomurabacteria bacterium RIFCSPLOWO2_02_FULL_44_12]